MFRTGLLCSIALMFATRGFADTDVNVTANAPTLVLLDGQPVGQAPLQIRNLPRGQHTVQVQLIGTSQTRVYPVKGRRRDHREAINVVWPRSVVVVPGGRPYGPRPVVVQGAPVVVAQPAPVIVQQAPPPVVVAAPPPGVVVQAYDPVERAKVRTRNTLVGAAVANELLNKGNSKSLIRGLTVGGALVNEVAR